MQAFRPLQRYFDFSGRSGRAEFWQFTLAVHVGNWIVVSIKQLVRQPGELPSLAPAYGLAMLIPSISVGFRRMHDIGRTAWPYAILLSLIGLVVGLFVANELALQQTGEDSFMMPLVLAGIALVGWGIYTIVLLARPGDEGANQYGVPDLPEAADSPPNRLSGGQAPAARAQRSSSYDDALTSIERLGRLKEQGLLTEEEFAAQKARLLGGG